MIQKIIDYWSMWHLLLATYAFLIAYFRIKLNKQVSFLAVLGLAIVYEASEWIWNTGAYASSKAMLLNCAVDVGMALLALFVTVLILKGVDNEF